MGAPVRGVDDNKPLKNEPPTEASTAAPKEVGAGSSTGTTEAPLPPWKHKTQRGVFEGDVAAVELRTRLALTPDRISEPAIRVSTVSKFAAVVRPTGVVLMAAAMAGVTGYLWGFRLSTKSPQLARASEQANVFPALSTPAASLKNSHRDSGPSTARTAAIGLAPADGRGAANDVASVDAVVQRPLPLATGERTASPSSAFRPPALAHDASEIAAKMKIGAELMAQGDITAARMMFQRAAEAGEAAAAFALAETYDPMVLRKLGSRGGIVSDLALARIWYEKARDRGSIAAPERIVRLTQIPQ
jgi:hypothetical protein